MSKIYTKTYKRYIVQVLYEKYWLDIITFSNRKESMRYINNHHNGRKIRIIKVESVSTEEIIYES